MSLLRPEAVLAKIITGGGQWGVQKLVTVTPRSV